MNFGNNGGQRPSIDDFMAMTDSALASSGGSAPLPSAHMGAGGYPPAQLDPAVQANYIGGGLAHDSPGGFPPQQGDYIAAAAASANGEDDDEPVTVKVRNMEDTYNKLQAPLFLAVLFFIFQLPTLKKWAFNYIPFGFTADGNYNAVGIFINSVVFGAIWYLIQTFVVC